MKNTRDPMTRMPPAIPTHIPTIWPTVMSPKMEVLAAFSSAAGRVGEVQLPLM